MNKIKLWLKQGRSPLARVLKRIALFALRSEWRFPNWYGRLMGALLLFLQTLVSEFLRRFVYTPAFRARLQTAGKNVYLYGGLPYQSGPLSISMGSDCRISGQTTFSGRSSSANPQLLIGDNVDVGWMTTIAVGNKVVLGNNVRIAGRAFLAGYPGHPLDAKRRAAGKADDDHQVGDIVLEDDVWLATGVTVAAGVTIGKGTIVAAGSVVTKDLPANVIAAGVPAVVKRQIAAASKTQMQTELQQNAFSEAASPLIAEAANHAH